MTFAATTRRVRFLPHRFADGGVTVTLGSYTVDGRSGPARFDPEAYALDLSALRFTTAELQVAVTLADGALDAVLPAAERGAPPAHVAIVVTCDATRIRRAVPLLGPPLATAGARFEGSVRVVRDELRGAVQLTPVLVRTAPGTGRATGHADTTGARLAAGRPIEVRIDAARSPHGEFLETRYESFATVGAPAFPHPGAMYQLDADGEEPVLWLNTDHPRVCSIVDSPGTVGRAARARDVVFGQISQAVWTRLFWRAARDVDDADEPLYPWQAAVLASLLPRVYPEGVNHESRLVALRADLTAGADHVILGRLDGALQEWLDIAGRATKLEEELA